MLIRSQNKEILVNFNVSAGIEIAEGTTKTVVTSYITGCSYLLGEYSTKKKAIKVLDMLQEACADAELVPMTVPNIGKTFAEAPTSKENELLAETIEKALMNKMVFQMPEDSEVVSDVMEIVQNEDGTFSAYDDAYDITIHCETEEEQKKVIERLSTDWIPVSERLPEKHKDVITTVKYNGFLGMYGTWLRTAFIGDYGEWNGECIGGKVVAWMPLPKPYKED